MVRLSSMFFPARPKAGRLAHRISKPARLVETLAVSASGARIQFTQALQAVVDHDLSLQEAAALSRRSMDPTGALMTVDSRPRSGPGEPRV